MGTLDDLGACIDAASLEPMGNQLQHNMLTLTIFMYMMTSTGYNILDMGLQIVENPKIAVSIYLNISHRKSCTHERKLF